MLRPCSTIRPSSDNSILGFEFMGRWTWVVLVSTHLANHEECVRYTEMPSSVCDLCNITATAREEGFSGCYGAKGGEAMAILRVVKGEKDRTPNPAQYGFEYLQVSVSCMAWVLIEQVTSGIYKQINRGYQRHVQN